MGEVITGYGDLAGICGHDGDDWRKVKVGADGALQIDVESTGNPSNLDIAISALRDAICAAAPTGRDLTDLYNRLGDLTDGLGSLLTELKLKADLTETQPVSLATAPTTAVTIADGVDVVAGAVADAIVAAGAVGTLSAKLRRLTTDLDALLTELKLKADLTETQPVSIATMPTTTVQAAGGDKIFAFESIVEEQLANTDLSAGVNQINGTPVASGKIWCVNNASIRYTGTSPTEMQITVVGLAVGLLLIEEFSPTSGKWYVWSGQCYMQAGDYVVAYVQGATAHDVLYCRYAGVRMDAP